MAKSLLDHAYDYVCKTQDGCTFNDLWAYVSEAAGLTKEVADAKVARFYTNLLLDGRFVTLGDNLWDLRERNTSDKVLKLDPKVLYGDSTADVHDEDIDEDSDENSDFDESNFEDEDEEENSEEENY
jgi:DNA-directed RNA polymerase subunit delta